MTVRRLKVMFLAAMLLVAAGTLFYFASVAAPMAGAKGPQAASQPVSRVSLPLSFEPNQGQTDPRVKFLSRGHGYGLFLTADEAVLELQPSAKVIRMRLAGSNSASRISGADLLPGKSNYFIGNNPAKWHRGIPQYARVNYEAVYPGVDLTYYGSQGQLEYDFRIAPGADPNQIALSFDGASLRLDAGELLLSTSHGDVRFHAPQIYQQEGSARKTVVGSFRQLADNQIGFQIGPYDRSRALIIDPVLSYATYLGGSGIESFTQIAVDSGLNMFVAGSTTSSDFPDAIGPKPGPANVFNVFVAKINPAGSALLYSTYLGGTGPDLAAGIAVIAGQDGSDATVAGTTSSNNFPTTSNAFQTTATGTHGFLTRLDALGDLSNTLVSYSTYLAGNGIDNLTGLAVDKFQNAYVTGTTTSTNSVDGFPSTAGAYQPCPFLSGNTCSILSGPTQFFATKINTLGSGNPSVLYSTYFGGDNPTTAQSQGGGIAVDTSGRMYFTGATNFLGVTGPNGEAPFPLVNAQQSCLDEAGITSNCANPPPSALDAILVKINPGVTGNASLVYSTYLGGSDNDLGHGVAVDGSANAYVTGETFSNPWNLPSTQAYAGGGDAFIAKVGNPTGNDTVFPLTFFAFVGGSAEDIGQAIAVDLVQAAHITGSTASPDFPVTSNNNLPPFGGGTTDAFAGLISTTSAAGNYLGFLGGNGLDQGTSIALDSNLDSSPTFVGGITQSSNLPTNPVQPPFQGTRNGSQDAFVAIIGSRSDFVLTPDPPVVNPSPASVGNQVSFTFAFKNNGPDPASNVIFSGSLPSSGFTFSSANSSPGGSCGNPVGAKVTCNINTVAAGATATVTVVLIPLSGTTSLIVVPSLSANGGGFVAFTQGSVQVTDFKITVAPTSVTITAGDPTSFTATLTPLPTYASTITVSDTGLPTGATGTFTTTSITLNGNTAATTTLNITTTARPVTTGSLLHGGPLYATWLPIGGLSLLGLGAGLRRRRWLAGTLLGLLAGLIVLQAACGNSSSNPVATGGTPAGTYTITITGSSGSVSHNFPVTLIVN